VYTDPDNAQCTALQTDRRTEGRHDDANSRSSRVAVRSAKNDDYEVDLKS